MLNITAEDNLNSLLTEYPFLAEPLLERGLHCVGCGLKDQDTLGQGLSVHGFNEDQIKDVVTELNLIAKNNND